MANVSFESRMRLVNNFSDFCNTFKTILNYMNWEKFLRSAIMVGFLSNLITHHNTSTPVQVIHSFTRGAVAITEFWLGNGIPIILLILPFWSLFIIFRDEKLLLSRIQIFSRSFVVWTGLYKLFFKSSPKSQT